MALAAAFARLRAVVGEAQIPRVTCDECGKTGMRQKLGTHVCQTPAASPVEDFTVDMALDAVDGTRTWIRTVHGMLSCEVNMFERDLGDGWTLAVSGGELVLRHANPTGGWCQVASVDEDGVFETGDYVARIPLAVLAAYADCALNWRMSNA